MISSHDIEAVTISVTSDALITPVALLPTLRPGNFIPAPVGSLSMPRELLSDITDFDTARLKKVGVYYVNRSLGKFQPKIHGYAAIGRVGEKNAITYNFDVDIMRTPFYVSDRVVKRVQESKKYLPKTKNAIQKLAGEHFITTEHFLRKLHTEEEVFMERELTAERLEKIAIQAAFPIWLYKKIGYFQDQYSQSLEDTFKNITRSLGIIGFGDRLSDMRRADKKAFKQNSETITYHFYSHIDPTIFKEVIDQHEMHQRYMNEKAGIGTAIEGNQSIDMSTTGQILAMLVHFVQTPDKKNPYEANCNKSIATVLQEAENISAERQDRTPERIKAPSSFAVGHKQRMFWPGLKSTLVQPEQDRRKGKEKEKQKEDETIASSKYSING